MNQIDNTYRIENAKKSLLGVSVGDAFGDSFFGDLDIISESIYLRQIPETKWEFTDDTVMSIAVFEELERNGDINQENLLKQFCINHDLDTNRGYGATLRRLLREVQNGENWHEVSKRAFEGQGSMGNGAAMRVCPIGAFHFDNFQKVKELSIKSAEITHSNIEAITGAIAIAIGTALTTQMKFDRCILTPTDFIDKILKELPDSDTKSKISKSKSVSYNYHIETVKSILGNGINMTAQDTVPFAIWCTAYNLQNFEEGLWKAVSILGDRDTICAIVGGMSIMSSDDLNIPYSWTNSVESIDKSVFRRNE
ncbi:ADP-ribosylglycohydrolase family protein [Flavobacterium sp. MC2016-06]|jgi:ADP-ribosylglycohydrolase|uniref:ADP-ribosylglycohydrolase family protein n=1 Tax=Flavobacterium sp. MC2016-06 TaxID=2676308 RepID=UPI0012BA86A9|nr:ADP-ribosylglycohydrolase family protein [Flavobacterium sp. MC2016-06]MBU3861777.1 ADP-ribosylglycohydrolase family protein [Flavobacterium sp. MC2016-06]